jgi:hypothetical protein
MEKFIVVDHYNPELTKGHPEFISRSDAFRDLKKNNQDGDHDKSGRHKELK